MASAAQTLLLRIDSDMSKLRRELMDAERATVQAGEKMAGRLNAVNENFRSVTGAASALRAVLAGAAGGALAAFTLRALHTADALQDAADRASVTTAQLQELGFAARQNGADQGSMNQALVMFSRRVGEAAQGTGELLPVLQRYGVGIRFASGQMRDQHGILLDVSDAIRRAESDQERAVIATAAFGRAGADLVPVFKAGTEGLENYAAKARATGKVLDPELVRQAAAAKDQLDSTAESINRLGQAIVLRIGPTLESWARGLENVLRPLTEIENVQQRLELMRDVPHKPRSIAAAEAYLDYLLENDRRAGQLRAGRSAYVGGNAVQPPLPPLTDEMLRGSANAVTYRSAQDKKLAEGFAESRRVIEDYERAARKLYEGTRTPAEKFLESQRQINNHLEYGRIDAETFDRAMKQATETLAQDLTRELESGRIDWEQYGAAVRQAGLTMAQVDAAMYRTQQFTRALGSAFDSMFEHTIASGGDWRAGMLGLLADVQRSMFQLLSGGRTPGGMIASALVSGVGGLFGAADLYNQGIPGVGPTGMGFSHFGGPRAEGGPVSPGTVYEVGEKGRELFVPDRPGTIVPNSMVANFGSAARPSGGGAGGIVVNQVFQAGVSRADLAAILPQVRLQTIAAVRELRLRDPGFFGQG